MVSTWPSRINTHHSFSRDMHLPGNLSLTSTWPSPNLPLCFAQYFWRSAVSGAALVAQMVKKAPAMWETWVQSLVYKNPLEKGKAMHSSILAWRIPWTVQSMGSQRVRHDWGSFTSLHFTSGLCVAIYIYIKYKYTDTLMKTMRLSGWIKYLCFIRKIF